MDDHVSLTIDADTPQVMAISRLPMANTAQRIVDPAEARRIPPLILRCYPEQVELGLDIPDVSDVGLYRIAPTVISVLDYSKGFAHTDRVAC